MLNVITYAALSTHSIVDTIAIAADCVYSVGSPGAMANTLTLQKKQR